MFGSSKRSEKRDAETAAVVAKVAESLGDTKFRRRFFLLFASLNAAVWMISTIFASQLYHLFTEVFSLSDTPGIAAISLPLGFGFYAAYAFLRMRSPDVEDNKQLGSNPMASYGYNTDSAKRWRVWVAASAFAFLNTLLLVSMVAWLGDS